MANSAPAMARVEPPLSVYLWVVETQVSIVASTDDIQPCRACRGECSRVESVFPEATSALVTGDFGKGVVGSVEDGVLAEHGHDEVVALCYAMPGSVCREGW